MLLFPVPSCTDFLVVGRVLKTFGDVQALFRIQPLRVVRMCEKCLIIHNIHIVVYNTDIYFKEVWKFAGTFQDAAPSCCKTEFLTDQNTHNIIFHHHDILFTKVFYFANLFLSESRHQPQSFSFAPTRQSSQFKNLGQDL